MLPRAKLFDGILTAGEIKAFRVFFGWDRIVCFAECTPCGVFSAMVRNRYRPWGIAFTKDLVFKRGGGPAFYVADSWADRKVNVIRVSNGVAPRLIHRLARRARTRRYVSRICVVAFLSWG